MVFFLHERNEIRFPRRESAVSLGPSVNDDTTPTPRPPVRYATLIKILVLYCSTLINVPTRAQTRTTLEHAPPSVRDVRSPSAFIRPCYVALSLIQYL